MRQHLRKNWQLLDDAYFAYAANTRLVKEFPLPGTFIEGIGIMVTGTLTPSAVIVPGRIHNDAVANLIQQLEVTLDGKPWKLGSGGSFFRIATRYDGTQGTNDGLYTGAAVAQTFECFIPLYAKMPGAKSPTDTLVDGRINQKVQIALKWGDTGSLVIGNTSTLTLTNTKASIYLMDTEPFDITAPLWLHKETEVPFVNLGTAADYSAVIPVEQGEIIRAIQLRSVDGSDLSDDIINAITVRINGGEEVPLSKLEDDFFQAMTRHLFGVEDDPDGYYHVEFAENGMVFTTGLGAGGGLKALEFRIDMTVGAGATSLVAHKVSMVPPQVAA